MGRRVTAGVVGTSGFGSITVAANTLATAGSNQDLVLDPNGTGKVQVNNDLLLAEQGDLRFGDADSSNYVAFQAPSSVSSNVTWTLPATDGTASQVLYTDGSGVLGWTSVGVALSDNTTNASIFYPTFVSGTSGSIASINVSSTKLQYQPSSGTFIATAMAGGTGASNVLYLRSTTNATKGQVYVDETTASTSTATGAFRVAGGMGVAGTIYTASIVETSSIAFKENINPIDSALEKITQLTGVVYDRKDKSSFNEAGLIAEEVEKVIPNIVTRNENGDIYGLQYTKLTAYLIEAVKSLSNEIKEIKSKLG